KEITPLDLNASLGNFQKVILFNKKGKKQIETTNDNSITYSPKFNPKDINTATIKKRHNSDYLIITNQIETSHLQGYSIIVHYLDRDHLLVNSLYLIALIF